MVPKRKREYKTNKYRTDQRRFAVDTVGRALIKRKTSTHLVIKRTLFIAVRSEWMAIFFSHTPLDHRRYNLRGHSDVRSRSRIRFKLLYLLIFLSENNNARL